MQGTIRTPCAKTDNESGVRRGEAGRRASAHHQPTLGYMVHFEDDGWYGYPYCPGCIVGIDLVEKCRCDPSDRDEFSVCVIGCVPEIKIRDMLMVEKGDTCVGCGVPLMCGFGL